MPSMPRVLLHAEGGVVLAASVVAYALLGHGWGWFALLVLAPDLAMLGYLAGPRAGSVAYNAAHSYLGPGLLAAAMWWAVVPAAWWLVAIWTAHIGADRLLGYGLKYPTTFKDTHLARV